MFWLSRAATVTAVAVISMLALAAATAAANEPIAWTPPAPIDHQGGLNFEEGNSISCPTDNFCAAVGSGGNVLTSDEPEGGAEAWTLTPIAGAAELTAVSCASASFCAAGDSQG